MKTIDIQINNAKILSYEVNLDKAKPEIGARIGLYCGDHRISTFGLRTETYYSDSITFELPADMIAPIVDIAKQLETILVRECNKQLKQLEAISPEEQR